MKTLISICAVAILTAGCHGPGGPAERTGRSVDRGAAKVGQAVENTGEKIKDTATR